MPHGEFLAELDRLYTDAGRPSLRRVSQEIRRQNDMPDTVSHETVGAILRGDALVRWSKVECVVRQLAVMSVHRPDPDDEVRRIHALWTALSNTHDLPPEPPRPPDPVPPPPVPTSTPAVSPLPGGTAPAGFAPQRNAGFTGRREQLELMAAKLRAEPRLPLVLFGLGGVGKTQLAAEYLHRHAGEYGLVWWITAEDPTQATAALATLGERQGWPVSVDRAQTVRGVLSRLESGDVRWLVVFDNAGPPDDIRPLLPEVGGDLVVTTRDAAWLEVGAAVEVDVFTREESVELLCARGHLIGSDEADQLADRLGDLPLALEQVAAMQSAARIPIEEFLRQLDDDRGLQVLKSVPSGTYPTTVVTAFEVAANRVRSESPAAAQLLEMASCLGAEPISLALLYAGSRQLPPPLGRMLDQPVALTEAIHRLLRYGLVKQINDGQAVQVHRLVQAIVRDTLPETRRAQAYANARQLLATANPARPWDPLTWDMYERIGPHLRPARMIEATDSDTRQVLLDHATYLYAIGDYEGSRRLSEAALDDWSPDGDSDDVQVYECQRRVVAALYALGRYREAYRRAEEAWSRIKNLAAYGPDHSTALGFADLLAVSHRVFGEYEDALRRDRETVEGWRRTRGDDDTATLTARNNLAASLRAAGDFRGAHDIDTQLADLRQHRRGPDHQDTLLSVSNLARDLYGLGEYKAALNLQQSTWAAYRALLGDWHPLVLAAWRTIVLGLRKTGELETAAAQSGTLYVACQLRLGTDHEVTLAAMMTHANTLCANGDPYRAYHLSAEAVDRYRRTYGVRNPLTLAAATNQAIILRAVGERSRARHVGEAAHRSLREVLGREHPYTIAAAIGLANDLVLAGELDSARLQLTATLEDARRVRGENHPDSLICAVNLGQLLKDPGAQQSLLDGSIDALQRALGAGHPVVKTAIAGRPGECDIEPPPV
ncbi:FxSxx-COOH system tetratricopeptide repeat protein [Actinoplanes subglobosus]|uniref:FxSxx-COOH system tetratricopeptide repeat protein n=1 Tax=Actinoplanes subglobosus TaxID=1547892 RepID=A0ABV8J6E9_9ACTN